MISPKQKVLAYLSTHPKLEEIVTTPDMRTNTSLYIASGISFGFTLFCIISGLFQNTRWFMTLGIYNFVLALIRLIPALQMRRKLRQAQDAHALMLREAKTARIVGIALLSVDLVFIGITAETIIRNHALHYHPFVLSILVLFSVSRFIILFIGTIKHRKESATFSHTLRVINMTVALVSLYTTQTAFLETYFTDEIFRLILNLIASSLIFYGLLRISVNLVLSARQKLTSDAP